MCDVVALVQRELRKGGTKKGTARRLSAAGVVITEQTVRRIAANRYRTERRRPAVFARCKCGGLVKADRPCLCCKLRDRTQSD